MTVSSSVAQGLPSQTLSGAAVLQVPLVLQDYSDSTGKITLSRIHSFDTPEGDPCGFFSLKLLPAEAALQLNDLPTPAALFLRRLATEPDVSRIEVLSAPAPTAMPRTPASLTVRLRGPTCHCVLYIAT